jgi:hypothetical protein
MSSIGPIGTASLDSASYDRSFYGGLQYLMPNTKFSRFDSRLDETPTGDAVISGNNWASADRLEAAFFVSADRTDHALWLMPGELRQRVGEQFPSGDLLGPEPVIGVRTIGFNPLGYSAGRPGRWTGGAARVIVNVDPLRTPLMLGIDVAARSRDSATLELRANGVGLWKGSIPRAGGAATFSLEDVPVGDELTVQILSDTIQSANPATGRNRNRTLGVLVRRLRVDARDDLATAAIAGLVLGAEQVLGYPEAGFHRAERYGDGPARWTNGAARLRIPLYASYLPERLEVATVVPTRDGTTLRIRANGVVLWNGEIPSGPWSRSLALAGVPLGNELVVELLSDTFRPAETVEGSTDRRTLGVMVRSIRLFAARISARSDDTDDSL